jgi:hypothetical protein
VIINIIKETPTHPENRELMTDWLATNKGGNRTNLAAYACERLNFRDAKGLLRISTTLKALRDLKAEGCRRLPESTVSATGRWNPRQLDCAVVALRQICGTSAGLGPAGGLPRDDAMPARISRRENGHRRYQPTCPAVLDGPLQKHAGYDTESRRKIAGSRRRFPGPRSRELGVVFGVH